MRESLGLQVGCGCSLYPGGDPVAAASLAAARRVCDAALARIWVD